MAGAYLLLPLLGVCHSSVQDCRRRYPTAAFPASRRRPNPNTRFRFQSTPSTRKNPVAKLNPVEESERGNRRPKDSALRTRTSLPRSVTHLFSRIRNSWADEIGLNIFSIALPAVLSLAADPIASLVDTAFVGHLEQALGGDGKIRSPRPNQNDQNLAFESILQEPVDGGGVQCKKFLPAVSTSLALAAGVGIVEAIVLSSGSGFLMNIMGISVDSPMRALAEHFLTLRSWGAPPIVIALAAQGAFRGLMDTKTPLFAVGVGNLLNGILDPILIFLLHLGIGGAAIATVISEYLITLILIWKLNKNIMLIPPNIDGEGILRYLKSGGLLIARTIAILVTMTLSTSMAARQGPIAMAGHQICLQVWLAISLLNDALALAGQALLAGVYSQGNYKQAHVVIDRVLQMGLITGIALAITMFLGFGSFSALFTTDSAVLEIAQSGILFVTVSQPVNALAFVFDGLYYGLSDFAYSAYSMALVALLSSLFLLVIAPDFGLAGVWAGLLLFMFLRVLAGFWRLRSKNSPWEIVRMKTEDMGK